MISRTQSPHIFSFITRAAGGGALVLAQEVLFFFPRMMACLRRGAIGRVFLTIVRFMCAFAIRGAKMPLFAPSVASQSGRKLQKLAARAARLRSLRAGTAPPPHALEERSCVRASARATRRCSSQSHRQ